MTDQARLIELLRARSVLHGDFLLASGRRSSHYVDARRTTMSAEGLTLIGRLGVEAIRAAGWAPDAVGGLTMGADPIACAIALASLEAPPLMNAFSVRKVAKDHGATGTGAGGAAGGARRVEGAVEPGATVVIVEDVLTSGASSLQAVQVVQQEGGRVLGVLAVVDREEGGKANVEAFGLKVVVMTTATALGLPHSDDD